MSTKYNLKSLAIVAMCFTIFSCKNSEVSPTEALQEVSNSYSKLGTRAPQSIIDAETKLAWDHLLEYTARYKSLKTEATLFQGYDVGVIPNAVGCPLNSERVTILVDSENTNPYTASSGWKGAWSIINPGKDVYMEFCRVDGRLFNNLNNSFSVLKLGANDPASSVGVTLVKHDNQDNGFTQIYPGSDAAPSFVDGNKNLMLYMTTFRRGGSGTSSAFPNLGFSYGVFGIVDYLPTSATGASANMATNLTIDHGYMIIDEEDDGNQTNVQYSGITSEFASFYFDRAPNFRLLTIRYYLAKVK